jgi:GNAT superfamily N-acetyltransferase
MQRRSPGCSTTMRVRATPSSSPWTVRGRRGVARLTVDGDAARVAVALEPAYRGRRLGTWMLLDAVHLASGLGVARLEASTSPDDAERCAALRRLDFVVDPARSSASNLVCVKTLHAAWPDF